MCVCTKDKGYCQPSSEKLLFTVKGSECRVSCLLETLSSSDSSVLIPERPMKQGIHVAISKDQGTLQKRAWETDPEIEDLESLFTGQDTAI